MLCNRFRLTIELFAALLCVAAALSSSPAGYCAEPSALVSFSLKSDAADTASVDVNLSFNMKAGQRVVLKAAPASPSPAGTSAVGTIKMGGATDPSLTIEQVQGASPSWLVTSSKDGQQTVAYKVTFASGTAQEAPEAAGGAPAPGAIAVDSLKAFAASDVLLAPQRESGGYLSESYSVNIQLGSGQKALAPWKSTGAGTYTAASTTMLLSNFMAWGNIKTVSMRSADPAITIGFSGGAYDQVKDSVLNDYGDGMLKIYGEMVRVLLARPQQSDIVVLVTGAGPYGLKAPASTGLRDSFLLFHGGRTLSGLAAAAASRGFFEMWNRWSLVPADEGSAGWFQQGMPGFYGYRVAGKLGMMDSTAAYSAFGEIYADYLSSSGASTQSLSGAEAASDGGLLASKGAALCATVDAKLARKGSGAARDIEWLLNQLAVKFNAFEGKSYSLVDMSEILEKGTGESWDRFFRTYVDGTARILSSGFSTTDIFGTTSGVVAGTKKLSGKNWVYLLIAILVILSIPIIFSTYIRRSIKLDLTMPRILPDDDDDD
jgi:hypothetical protein